MLTLNSTGMSEVHYLTQIKKCVTFIFIFKEGKYIPLGTGFFVGVQMAEKFTVYLVTAKHVLQSENGDFYNEVYLRLNTYENIAKMLRCFFEPSNLLIHHDKNVDIICTPCFPDSTLFDYKFISDSYFTDERVLEEKGISEGTDIFYAGLFFNYYGDQQNHPLIRFGKVSSLTNEKIRITKPTEPLKVAHLYLFESHSLGGFSGSPVFFQLDRLNKKGAIHYGNPEIYLSGVMKGHYNDFIISPVAELKDNILRELNLGISAVTPCYLLKEILFSPSEIKLREANNRFH